MYLDRLKRKYQQILHGSCRQDSSTHLSPSNQRDKLDRRARVLTQHNDNSFKTDSSGYIIALKQRVAQSTLNLKLKEEQCTSLREQVVRRQEKIRLLQQQVGESRQSIEAWQQRVVQAKVVTAGLQQKIVQLQKQLQAFAIDQELVQKQAEYYKKEISKASKQRKQSAKHMNAVQKHAQDLLVLKNENGRLREDIKRLQVVINEMCQQKLGADLSDKHYLGKPIKEVSLWFSQNLIGEVQHFLKKEQIGAGNKTFLNNLVKFISKCLPSSTKNSTKNSEVNSRVKSSTGKHSHMRSVSLYDAGYSSLYDPGTSFIKKTQGLGTSVLKKSLLISKYKKVDSRKYTTESLMVPEKDNGDGPTYSQILRQYKRILIEALSEREIKMKTILSLTDEMSEAIANFFQSLHN